MKIFPLKLIFRYQLSDRELGEGQISIDVSFSSRFERKRHNKISAVIWQNAVSHKIDNIVFLYK